MLGSVFCTFRKDLQIFAAIDTVHYHYSLITSATTGYDGSMMNGLQSLTQWEDAFNHPSGGKLGLLNAIQVHIIGIHPHYAAPKDFCTEYRISSSLSYVSLFI